MGVFKKNGYWYIDYYVDGRRKREKVGPNKRQAQLVLKKRRVQVAEGKFLDIRKTPRVTFKDIAATYLETYAKPNKRSWTRDETCIKNLSPYFANKYLHEITPLDIERYKKKRTDKVTPRTVNIEVKFLKALYNKAISWGKADKNPVKEVTLFPEDSGRVRYLEKDKIGQLVKACSDHLRPIVITALNTGMRKREILDLKWSDIDLYRKTIYIIRSKGGRQREVPINSVLYQTLCFLGEKEGVSSYVFASRGGRPYGNITKSFKSALKGAGIKNFRFHDLRHTFASHLVMSGVDLKTVQELLGHQSIAMTLRYAHLSRGHKRRAVERLCSEMDTRWTPG